VSVPSVNGKRKAAAILVALGPDLSSKVLGNLDQSDVEELVLSILTAGPIGEEAAGQVIEEFFQRAAVEDAGMVGGSSFAHDLLIKVLGEQRASEIFGRLAERAHPRPFEFLRNTDPTQLATYLQAENPQAVALVLGHLPQHLAATILKTLPSDMRGDVAIRLASMDTTPPEVVKAIEATLMLRTSGFLTTDNIRVGGAPFMAQVLSQTDRTTEKMILQSLDEFNPEMGSEVRRLLFTFDQLRLLDDRALQRVLREVDMKDLAIALKNAAPTLRDQIQRNLSQRTAEMLQEELGLLGTLRNRQVQEAEQRIVAVVRRLEEQEEIVIERGGDDSDA